jgi:beta-xylosidase
MIETSLLFDPKDNNQFAGLILYESNENFIQAGNSYCDPVNGCEGQGLYFDIYLDGNLTLPRVINKVELVSLSLRVTRQGNLFSFFTSPDGKVWYLVTRQEVAMKALQVGLVAGQNVDGNTPPAALFDYFEINKVE